MVGLSEPSLSAQTVHLLGNVLTDPFSKSRFLYFDGPMVKLPHFLKCF
jgi:hypothetical protein